jgi:hypothetical protein
MADRIKLKRHLQEISIFGSFYHRVHGLVRMKIVSRPEIPIDFFVCPSVQFEYAFRLFRVGI